jgi:hypothetical protein
LSLFSEGADLPEAPDERGCLILALPRTTVAGAGLDRFLGRRKPDQIISLLFLYDDERLTSHAAACASVYGGRQGVRPGYFLCGKTEIQP